MDDFARLTMQYRYKDESAYLEHGNIGDCIQNIAVEQIYKKLNINNAECINRDDLTSYSGGDKRVVMQGWFGNTNGTFPLPWSDNIKPIFLGFHLSANNNSREMFVANNVTKYMQEYQPVGCRDRNTRDFLQSFGIDAYFSGCLTLTFDKRTSEPKNSKVFIVDLNTKSFRDLPDKIRKQGDFSITHLYKFKGYPISESDAFDFETQARNILERYKQEARMIITSRIHVAMPCVAMGIPVIFITDKPHDERFDVLRGILPIYHYRDMKYVNWNPKPANIDTIKKLILNNAMAQITNENAEHARILLERETRLLRPKKKKSLIRYVYNMIRY